RKSRSRSTPSTKQWCGGRLRWPRKWNNWRCPPPMAPSSMPASKPSSKKVVVSTPRYSAKRWLGGSKPPKKRGADPELCLRPQEGKPRAERPAVNERRRRGPLHPSLLEMYLRQRRILCSRRIAGGFRQALHQDRTEALLPVGGGAIVRLHQRTDARDAGRGPLSGDRADDGRRARQGDGSVSSRGCRQ